ncbi:hypothetical protein FLX56_14375 [Synechococcus moorigangaii CMS01]|nr:hypothetical protein [Synechococcus moorigangaii CMS01]
MRAIAIFSPSRRSGKSWLVTALGRSLMREGWRVVPFQSQTEITQGYRVNSLAEISQSAAWQAWATGLTPNTHLNPVVLKACGPANEPQTTFQLLIQGRGIGTVKRTDYYETYYDIARPLIRECLLQLEATYDLLLFDSYRYGLYHPIHGETDQNFELLKSLGLPTAGLLLVDCTHEGEISQLWGLWQRLSPENRQGIRGVIFNQWQGDRQGAVQNTQWVQTHLRLPVLGYIPPLRSLDFNPESLLTCESGRVEVPQNKLQLQVLQLPHISPYAEFDPLMSEPSVQLKFVNLDEPLGYPDALILPHTQQAIAALEELHKHNYSQQLQQYIMAGGTVLGIGNGANLLSKKIRSPQGEFQAGLGLLPSNSQIADAGFQDLTIETLSRAPFPNLPLSGRPLPWGLLNGDPNSGYSQLFATPNLGLVSQSQTLWAVYLQGLFNNGPWRRFWLNSLRQKRGLGSLPTGIADFSERKEAILEGLANHVTQHLDLTPLFTDPN